MFFSAFITQGGVALHNVPENIASLPHVDTYDPQTSAAWDTSDVEKPTARFFFREGGQRGENLFRLLTELKVERGLPPTKSVSVCTDGAKNMTSDSVGLATCVVNGSRGCLKSVRHLSNVVMFVMNVTHSFVYFNFYSFVFICFPVHCISHGGNLAGGDTVKAYTPFSNAKKTTQNVRVFVMQPGRMTEYAHQRDVLHPHAYVLIDQSRTRFLALGDAAVRMFQQMAPAILAIRAVVQSATDGKVRTRGNSILRSVTSKSYLICLSIEAMVVSNVNIMNRSNQGRKVNFSSYRVNLEKTTKRLKAMADGNEVMQWLQYRLQQNESLRQCYAAFAAADFELGRRRTIVFVDKFVDRLNKRIPQLELLQHFDVMTPSNMPRHPQEKERYGVASILVLFRTFIAAREPHLKVLFVCYEIVLVGTYL
jgi:hypothetical protein